MSFYNYLFISSNTQNCARCSRVWNIERDSKFHGANMGPTWVLSAPDGPHVGPMKFAIWGVMLDHFTTGFNSVDWILDHHEYAIESQCIIVAGGRCVFLWTNAAYSPGIILQMSPANGRRRYNVTSSLISWAHAQNDHSIFQPRTYSSEPSLSTPISTCTLTHWGRDIMAAIFQTTFSNAFSWMIRISLEFVPKVPIDNKGALVQIIPWCQIGDKPLSELIVCWHIYVSLGLNELKYMIRSPDCQKLYYPV